MNRIRIAALALAAFAVAIPAHLCGQTIQVNKDNRTIAITTTDEAQAIADRAVVSVGFTVYGADQDQTYADASKTSNAIMAALKSAGIKSEAIESTEQNLSAIDDNDKLRYNKGIRFVGSQGWTVTVSAEAAADTLHVAITAGANNSGNINWQLLDGSKLEDEAAEKALTHAREMAERMTKGLNATLGSLVYASNQTPARPGFFGYLQTETASVSSIRGRNLKPLAIRPEMITKSATVYAVFSLQ